MKKVLLSCVAVSVLLAGIAVIGLNKKNNSEEVKSITIPVNIKHTDPNGVLIKKDENKNTDNSPNGANKTSSNSEDSIRTYSLMEEQILEAAETYLYYQNLDDILHPDVKSDGEDFIITFDNPNDPDMPKYELKMERIDDFDGKKQYKITSESWIKWAETIRTNFVNPQISVDEYTETISWVPELKLITNSSAKANDIIINDKDIKTSIGSFVADFLVGQKADKIDVATANTINGMTIKTDLFQLVMPKITQNAQIIEADITGDDVQQVLTSKNISTSIQIPTLELSSPMLGKDPITAALKTTLEWPKNLEIGFDLSDIVFKEAPIKNVPQNIGVHLALSGINRADLQKYVQLNETLVQEDNPDSDLSKKTTKELEKLTEQTIKNMTVNVQDIAVTFENGSINLTGDIKPAQTDIDMNLHLSVQNFDALSPVPQPIDEEACNMALKNLPAKASQLPTECIQKSEMLDPLRPFLDTAKRTTNAAGQSVDTFDIKYNSDGLSINGQIILDKESISAIQHSKELSK